jgi:DNA-binding NarL/FixJ family response regulator/tetratricopeptide (TPR) repeat protein
VARGGDEPELSRHRPTAIESRVAGQVLRHASLDPPAETYSGYVAEYSRTEAAESQVARGREAMADGRWTDAVGTFESALLLGEDPDATFGLGVARWWLGDNGSALRAWERAFVLYRRAHQPPAAVMAAFYLCLAYQMTYGNAAAARGWLGRAARVAAGPGGEGTEGWVALARAHLALDAGQPAEAERWAREASGVAGASGDVDLELCAVSELGAALIEQGRDRDGGALLDEAMAGAVGGEIRDPDAVVLISCRTITAASHAGDLRRVVEWVAAADGFHRRYGSPHLYATCRAQYGAILFATGRWSDAERELEHALHLAEGAEASVRADAIGTLAELRLAQGRADEAARLLSGYESHPPAVVPMALHLLGRGQPRAAATIVRRRLRRLESGSTIAARLQELLVSLEIRSGRIEAAADLAERLETTARATESLVVHARAAKAAGSLALAHGDPRTACEWFEVATDAFERTSLPLDAARSRLLLAEALVETDRESAIVEAQAALAALETLGAACDADGAAAFLRSLGVRPRRRVAPTAGILTRRELEVLALVGEGLSNRQIADRLFITPKTAEHHVASILAKTGLSRRTEAAAYAIRNLHGVPRRGQR